MPLWRVFSNPKTFSPEQRDALAKTITSLYSDTPNLMLPAFYVNVLFIDIEADHMYVGGEHHSNFVRIVAEQIARQMPSPTTDEGAAYRKAWLDRIHDALRPHILDRKELSFEFHIAETPRDLWRIDGFVPPPSHSEGEKLWYKQNHAVPY